MYQLLAGPDNLAPFFETSFSQSPHLVLDSSRPDRASWTRKHRTFLRHENVDALLAANASSLGGPLRLGHDVLLLRIAREHAGFWGRSRIASFYPGADDADRAAAYQADASAPNGGAGVIAPHGAAGGPDVVDHQKVHDAFADGFELVVRSMQVRSPAVHELTDALATFWMVPVTADLHFMPNELRKLRNAAPVFSAEDLFIVQLDGEQTVYVYADAVEAPTARHAADDDVRARVAGDLDGVEPAATFKLVEGDVLYIPRGYAFDARTAKKISLHLTVHVETHKCTAADAVVALIDTIARSDDTVDNPLRAALASGTVAAESSSTLPPTYADLLREAVRVSSELAPELRSYFHASEPVAEAVDEADGATPEAALIRHADMFTTAADEALFDPLMQYLSDDAVDGGGQLGEWARSLRKGQDADVGFDKASRMFQRCLLHLRKHGKSAVTDARERMISEHVSKQGNVRPGIISKTEAALVRHGAVFLA
jgi:hypothetical protein